MRKKKQEVRLCSVHAEVNVSIFFYSSDTQSGLGACFWVFFCCCEF